MPPGDERRGASACPDGLVGRPHQNTLDRATAMFPDLLYHRLDELGIDFAVLYPTYGLTVTAFADDELRRAMAGAFNALLRRGYADYADRLDPGGVHPDLHARGGASPSSTTPSSISVFRRSCWPAPSPARIPEGGARWRTGWTHSATDSLYDYDPVGRRCDRLGVSPTFHSTGAGWGTRMSTTNYVYNHIGNFAAAGEATARSLFFGGVPRRFPELRFAFQEGGVAWACNLLLRHPRALRQAQRRSGGRYDPAGSTPRLDCRCSTTSPTGPVREQR